MCQLCVAPCGRPGERCCPETTTSITDGGSQDITAQPANTTLSNPRTTADAPCRGRADCIEGVCAFCGRQGDRCCDGGACGLGSGAPLTCNPNNICVFDCGVLGAACCTDADFAAVIEAYEEGLFTFSYSTDDLIADVAASDARGRSVGGCFSGTECGAGDVCVPREDINFDAYIGMSNTFCSLSKTGSKAIT